MPNQKTISKSIFFDGVGLHTGSEVNLEICPAPENYGIKFQRTDLENQPIIPALVDFVSDTQRSTTIEKNTIKVVTIEHLMSALYALGVNNILIKMKEDYNIMRNHKLSPLRTIIFKNFSKIKQFF